MAVEPVCGRTVDEKTAQLRSEYLGKTYSFGSAGCKKTFDDEPARYIGGQHASMGHEGHVYHQARNGWQDRYSPSSRRDTRLSPSRLC